MQKIHLIRHAQSEANLQKIVCGQKDCSLSLEGIAQAKMAASKTFIQSLLNFTCYSSPLVRALDTARYMGFKKVIPDALLMETNTGDYSERDLAEFSLEYPEFQHYQTNLDAKYPNGESTRDMMSRSRYFISNLLEETTFEEVIIVSHAGPINSILGLLLGTPSDSFPNFSLKNGSLTTIARPTPTSKYWILENYNLT